ncbi:MAG: alpha/beta hydrolase, partial [Planctomycetota bacterium]|nr:alpha/beta hydrolase [Planctomycetota bacterium]
MPNTTINDVDLFYETHGEGEPLMLVAGLASDSQSWLPIVGDLAQGYFVIAPDNRGVGRTRPQDIGTSIRQIADDCIGLIGHLGLSSVNLLGHSMGGFVALDMAIRYPGHVDKLILAATAASNSSRNNALFAGWASSLESGMGLETWFRNIFFWLFTAQFFENQTAVNAAVRYAVEYPYPQGAIAFRNQVEAIAGFDCTEGLRGITAKTMVISGKEDLLFPTGVCAGLARAIPGADFHEIDDAAHSIHM